MEREIEKATGGLYITRGNKSIRLYGFNKDVKAEREDGDVKADMWMWKGEQRAM